jgi:AraC family transcriptional regulator
MATADALDEASSISVAACTLRHASITAGGFYVSDVVFGPNRRLPRHSHPRGCIAVVVEGVVDKAFTRVSGTAKQGAVITMPPAEPHVDAFGRGGARLIVAEANEDREVALGRDWTALLIATRIARELEHPDAFTPLAVEGLALELAVAARRLGPPGVPSWLRTAREIVLDHAPKSLSVAAIAAQVDVEPGLLARSFRRHFGVSIGEYVRNARLDWAAARLVDSDEPLGSLAFEAGFADQSHFTRCFKRRVGVPPGRYRRLHR